MMKYNVYNGTNPIKEEVYSKIYKIIINNYGIREKLNTEELKKKDTVAAYNNWIHTILYTKDYNIVVFYNTSNTIIGFIAFMYTETGLCLSEVQIVPEYQSKNNTLRKMLKIILEICDKKRSKKIFGTINHKNIKSINVFTHIGFNNIKENKYEISYDNLLKWVYEKK